MPLHLVYSGNPMPDLSWIFFRFAPFLKKHRSPLTIITADTIILNLKEKTKETVISELLNLLQTNGKFLDHATVLNNILDRERVMSTAIPNGIAIPHTKTNAVQELTIAIGIKNLASTLTPLSMTKPT
jgi:hypothetical protein